MQQSASVLWSCYNPDVNIVNYQPQYGQIGANGTCPHCRSKSLFMPVGAPHISNIGNVQRICNAAECQGCKKFVLVVGERYQHAGEREYRLVSFFPTGTPDDAVDANIPVSIGADLSEALRCRWIKAYRAAVVMCRRAIQAACIDKGMADKKLESQIDEMAAKGLITEPLKHWAHEVRLGGNDGAHPDKDGLKDVAEQDADELIQFAREFLHHVYVMPAALASRQASRAAMKAQPKP